MDFDEFEKRVTELLFEVAGDERKQNVLCFIDQLRDDYKKDCENFIKNLYDDVCFIYDSPDIYGENCKDAFCDDRLKATSVSTLYMLYGDDGYIKKA